MIPFVPWETVIVSYGSHGVHCAPPDSVNRIEALFIGGYLVRGRPEFCNQGKDKEIELLLTAKLPSVDDGLCDWGVPVFEINLEEVFGLFALLPRVGPFLNSLIHNFR